MSISDVGLVGLSSRTQAAIRLLIVTVLLVPAPAASGASQKSSYIVLHRFTGGDDGGQPVAGLIRDAEGNLYGTAEFGGAFGYGTVFKLDAAGKETVLHTFTGGDGLWPLAALVRDDAGNLYGTTWNGGTSKGGACIHGCGTVFKMDKAGKETVLHAFTGGADGGYPAAGLTFDAAGNLYGTTAGGGKYPQSCCGVVFKIDKYRKETVLYTFTGGNDGNGPSGGVIRDKAGNLYGSTGGGGPSNAGVVFRLDPGGKETVLYSFIKGTDGGWPSGTLVRDGAGNLYGEATIGGDVSASACQRGGSDNGCGVVFKVEASGKESVLYTFKGGHDQGLPNGGLLRDRAGNFYGTTGDVIGGCSPFGCGTVFKLAPDGTESVLHSFSVSGGIQPFAGVTIDEVGNIYGTTSQGGYPSCGNGCGTVFELTP
jgi:uncharacterized repeat protein (TIGR03803 family)